MSDGYGEFARLTATPLDRAVDRAIDDVNDQYLKLLADHRCAEHVQPMRQLDGTTATVCGVCYRTIASDGHTFKLPPVFYDDHIARDLPEEGVTRVVRRTQRNVFVEMDRAAFKDLLSDADYYSDASMFDSWNRGLCASARATHRALREQAPDAWRS